MPPSHEGSAEASQVCFPPGTAKLHIFFSRSLGAFLRALHSQPPSKLPRPYGFSAPNGPGVERRSGGPATPWRFGALGRTWGAGPLRASGIWAHGTSVDWAFVDGYLGFRGHAMNLSRTHAGMPQSLGETHGNTSEIIH